MEGQVSQFLKLRNTYPLATTTGATKCSHIARAEDPASMRGSVLSRHLKRIGAGFLNFRGNMNIQFRYSIGAEVYSKLYQHGGVVQCTIAAPEADSEILTT